MGGVAVETRRLEGKFRILVGGEKVGQFAKVESPYKAKVGVAEYRSGDSNVVVGHSATKVEYTPFTLVDGTSDNTFLYDWWVRIIGEDGVGAARGTEEQKTVVAEQLAEDNETVVERTTYKNAFPSEFDNGGFDADSDKYRMRSVVMKYLSAKVEKIG